MIKRSRVVGIEINPKLVGVLFTDKVGNTLRVFCYYTNGDTSQFDAPIDENQENLRGLLATLNVEDTCTSVILDEAVQGRIYVQAENRHWLYTLLNSPDNILLPLNADIGDLPWEVVWRSAGAEVLQHSPPGEGRPCFAIRTPLNESDAARLMQNSKAFTNPTSPRRKQPQRWLYINMAIALLALAFVVTGTLYYTFRHRHAAPASAPVVATTKSAAAPVAPDAPAAGYLLLYNHQISGPYPAQIIASMKAGGLFNDETLCRAENSTEWTKLTASFPPSASK